MSSNIHPFDLRRKIWEEKFAPHLNQDEPELVLLKGHLILERLVNELLYLAFEKEKELDTLRLSFAKKITLLNGLSSIVKPEKICYQLMEINNIRNKLAHNLEFDDYHETLKNWATEVTGNKKKLNKKNYLDEVKTAFLYLGGYLGALIVANELIKECTLKAIKTIPESEFEKIKK